MSGWDENVSRTVFLTVIAMVLVCSCSSRPPISSRLDSSGVTVVTLGDALLLAHPVHQLAAAARDYAYIGPVRVNRSGNHEHYLWIGLASTIDRSFANASLADAASLGLVVDGQPMVLELTDLSTELDEPPYETSAPLYATLTARASLDQIERIANGETIETHFISSSGTATRYQMWGGDWSSWSLFVDSDR